MSPLPPSLYPGLTFTLSTPKQCRRRGVFPSMAQLLAYTAACPAASTLAQAAAPDSHGALRAGRTVLAVAGESYAIVAGSTRMSTGFSILTRESSKFAQMCAPALRPSHWPPALRPSHCPRPSRPRAAAASGLQF